MKSQSSLGKGKKSFLWKYENDEYSFPEGVGHTARQVITDFINKNRDKSIEYFQKEFEFVKLGPEHPRIVLLEHAKKAYEHAKKVNEDTARRRYFFDLDDPKYHIKLDNDEIVVISREWGATGKSKQQWRDFKNKMAELGYSIIIDEKSGR